jgi:hypothetical protein
MLRSTRPRASAVQSACSSRQRKSGGVSDCSAGRRCPRCAAPPPLQIPTAPDALALMDCDAGPQRREDMVLRPSVVPFCGRDELHVGGGVDPELDRSALSTRCPPYV